MNIIIIANGEFPRSDEPLSYLRKAEQVVCCDGAFEKYLRWRLSLSHPLQALCDNSHIIGNQPVTVVGDGDSMSPAVWAEAEALGLHPDRIKISEQETNDLTKAVTHTLLHTRQEGIPDRDIHITILGATGLREDHTLGNISLLGHYAEQYPDAEFRMVSDYGIFRPVLGRETLDTFPGQQVSLFSLTPDTPVSVEGLRYPISGRPLRQWWEGTLNEAIGDRFTVDGGLLIVYQTPTHND